MTVKCSPASLQCSRPGGPVVKNRLVDFGRCLMKLDSVKRVVRDCPCKTDNCITRAANGSSEMKSRPDWYCYIWFDTRCIVNGKVVSTAHSNPGLPTFDQPSLTTADFHAIRFYAPRTVNNDFYRIKLVSCIGPRSLSTFSEASCNYSGNGMHNWTWIQSMLR